MKMKGDSGDQTFSSMTFRLSWDDDAYGDPQYSYWSQFAPQGDAATLMKVDDITDETSATFFHADDDGLSFGMIDETGMTFAQDTYIATFMLCLLYTSPSPRDLSTSRMPSSA